MKFSNDVEKNEIEVSKMGQNYPLYLMVKIMEQFSSWLYDVKQHSLIQSLLHKPDA